MRYKIVFFLLFLFCNKKSYSQEHSIARKWNEVLLQSIRNDLARPTVHARNLFHISAAMYDAWSVFDKESDTYFLKKENHGFFIPYKETKFYDW